MAQLLHLDGRPQTWDELHARLAEYCALRTARERVCGPCTNAMHGRCTGRMARVPGGSALNSIECPCECWEMKR